MSWFKRDLGAMLVVAAALTAVVGCGKTETAADKKDAAGKKDGDKKDADKKEGEKSQAAGAGTPEETFKAVKAALEKEDWKGFTSNLTPESRDMFAGMMGFAGVMIHAVRGSGVAEGAEKVKPIGEVFAKHGLTEDVLKKMEEEKPGSPEDGMKKLVEPVKDRDQFVADMMVAMKAFDDGKKEKSPISKDAELKDLKIDGDSATASIEFTKEGTKTTEPIAFKKVDGKWLVDIAELMKKEMGGGLGGPGGPDGPGNLPGPGDLPGAGDLPGTDAPAAPDAGKTPEEPKE